MRAAVYLGAGLLVLTTMLVTGGRTAAAEGPQPSVEMGKKLFSDPALGTNGKTCATCHASDAAIAGLASKKSWFGGEAGTLEQAVNICIKGPLEGKPLAEDSVEARSIAMFMKSLIKN